MPRSAPRASGRKAGTRGPTWSRSRARPRRGSPRWSPRKPGPLAAPTARAALLFGTAGAFSRLWRRGFLRSSNLSNHEGAWHIYQINIFCRCFGVLVYLSELKNESVARQLFVYMSICFSTFPIPPMPSMFDENVFRHFNKTQSDCINGEPR